LLVEVNETDGNLSLYGEVNHSSFYDSEEDNRYWGWGEQNIRRSIFMGDYVYAISPGGITATNLTTMEESARLSIPPSKAAYERYYYGDDVAVSEERSDESDEREEDRPNDSSSDEGDREPRDA